MKKIILLSLILLLSNTIFSQVLTPKPDTVTSDLDKLSHFNKQKYFTKDEFETTKEYYKRVFYNKKYKLTIEKKNLIFSYNADKKQLTISINSFYLSSNYIKFSDIVITNIESSKAKHIIYKSNPNVIIYFTIKQKDNYEFDLDEQKPYLIYYK